ncbi:MAG TPA: toll/interleukin-1 receptor domain-containing protein, partial [Pyrinomonadaceae bacterium]
MASNPDLFVSHNSKDKTFIDYIAKRLNDEYDVKLWLDKWSLEAAVDWAPAIEKALQSCDSCAVVLGANGWGPHHLGEAQLALKRKREYPNFRVIPILLPGASSDNMVVLGDFFQQVHRVEFTGHGLEEEAFQRLWATIRGEAP